MINLNNLLKDNKELTKKKFDDIDNIELLKEWDFNNDYIHENENKLLNITDKELYKYGSRAYVLNTAKGIYYKEANDIDNYNLSYSIYLDNGQSKRLIFYDAIITGTTINNSFMIIYDRKNGYEYLIDNRGIIFELSKIQSGMIIHPYNYSIKRNLKTCCFDIEGYNKYHIPYLPKEEFDSILKDMASDDSLIINDDFIKFLNKRKHEKEEYLYFTLSNGKNGAICRYFCEKYGNYEILPNVFIDDETVNVRIKMPPTNIANEDHYFMHSKYEISFKNYSIYNVPIQNYIGALEISRLNLRKIKVDKLYPKPSLEKAPMYISINETLKKILNFNDDFELFEKIYHKMEQKIDYSFSLIDYERNKFENIKIDYPSTYDKDFIIKKKDYYEKNEIYKEALSSYEANILEKLLNENYYIPRWKSESDLYALVKKYYNDTIFQYRSSWLGQQSIDVYIPSLKIGFEYQGEQHFKAIDFFGGIKGLEETQKRDSKKMNLCKNNNVNLIYWNYDELINESNLKKKLKDFNIELIQHYDI